MLPAVLHLHEAPEARTQACMHGGGSRRFPTQCVHCGMRCAECNSSSRAVYVHRGCCVSCRIVLVLCCFGPEACRLIYEYITEDPLAPFCRSPPLIWTKANTMASQNTSSAKSSNQSRVREALTGGSNVKEKGPPVADGFLSVTPDTPDVLEWRSKSLDIAETSSTYLDDEDDGAPCLPR